MRLALLARRRDPLMEVLDTCRRTAPDSFARQVDVTERAAVEGLVQEAVEQFGRVDVLVNNAGSALHAGPLHEIPDAAWNEIIDVFLTSVFRFSRAVIPQMLRQGGGAIVNIGSVLGLKASPGFPVHPYAAAKAGVAMLTRTVALQYAKDHIRCNCVAPAITETPLTAPRLRDSATRRALEAVHPLGLGAPEDVARAVLYLASDEARWTTGVILPVDGGVLA
jgi:NAD(P)-dependent dehydrogenase (short-subunit alcohol dehydrogenase family)